MEAIDRTRINLIQSIPIICNQEIPVTYASGVWDVFVQRKEAAKRYLETDSEVVQNECLNIIIYSNDLIKRYLGII